MFLAGYLGSQFTAIQAQFSTAEKSAAVENASQLLMSATDVESGKQITLIDVKSKAISVYFIDRVTGQIQLLSTRNYLTRPLTLFKQRMIVTVRQAVP